MESLENKLHYTFRRQELLQEALNHSSYANEHRRADLHSNERLEFLGDSVLGFVTAEFLFRAHGKLPEGDLTRMRAALVCEQSLYQAAQQLELGQYLRLGKGEELGGGRHRPSILADAVEAVIAAIYLDSGMESAKAFITRILFNQAPAAEDRKDYKTTLQELIQRRSGQSLSYRMVSESGPDHQKSFLFEVALNGAVIGQGEGRSKKEAEQSAARDALSRLSSEA